MESQIYAILIVRTFVIYNNYCFTYVFLTYAFFKFHTRRLQKVQSHFQQHNKSIITQRMHAKAVVQSAITQGTAVARNLSCNLRRAKSKVSQSNLIEPRIEP